MRGNILEFNAQSSTGLISADDGSRYSFSGQDVKSNFQSIRAGSVVDFEAGEGVATSVYPIGASANSSSKSKITAGVLAILLGGLGVHKFYLGYTVPGVIMLVIALLGGVLLFIPNLILGVIALIEGILYLTKSDEEFEDIYVSGTKHWF